ncbi:MAG TPA: hypothetical protein VFY66_14840, partial [Anaerolineales bacterium]|nr:hypothetical protein [Anaerolineales bacterium]
MQRKFRLTRSEDFKRVRRSGKSYAHPLVVLIVQAHEKRSNPADWRSRPEDKRSSPTDRRSNPVDKRSNSVDQPRVKVG